MLKIEEVKELQIIKGVAFPAEIKFRQLLITGVPGAGKTTMINKLGGWSEEGYLDLSMPNWWRAQSLALRPREIHLGFPFAGYDKALAVFDKEWRESPTPPELDLSRLQIPPAGRFFFSVNWRVKYVFEFVIRPAGEIFASREKRALQGTHHVDENVTLERVQNQVTLYERAAYHLHRAGMQIYIRDDLEAPPKRIIDQEE
ncbi:MAG: serine/threonine protein phosphatase [Gammaproteobacteria bacterium]|nr:serine/threonine protein phosphatase [Gammaproteobacteria bacterium]